MFFTGLHESPRALGLEGRVEGEGQFSLTGAGQQLSSAPPRRRNAPGTRSSQTQL